jgi:ribosomal protein S18 acetylase RimI-like enzyme
MTYVQTWEGRDTQLAISYPETREAEIAFFAGKNFQCYDALLQMRRDLSISAPDLLLPEGISIQRWSMETGLEKQQYIAAAARAFPQAPQTIADIEFYMQSWKGGIPLIAFDSKGEIAGGLMAFWYGIRNGVTEDIFVLPPWRRKGIARCLIAEGIGFLKEHEIEIAWLEVKESNIPAVQLYLSMGYEIANREEQWAKTIII